MRHGILDLFSLAVGCVSWNFSFTSRSSASSGLMLSSADLRGSSTTCFICDERGKTLRLSSITMQRLFEARDKINRSLNLIIEKNVNLNCIKHWFCSLCNLAITSVCASVRYLAWTSMDMVNNCFNDDTDFNRRTIMPPPSTVSIVLE